MKGNGRTRKTNLVDVLFESRKKFESFDLDGNNLSLDFVNTCEYRNTDKEIEWIASYADALCWAEHAAILSPSVAGKLAAAVESGAAASLRDQIVRSREKLYDVFLSVIDGKEDPVDEIRSFNELYQSVHQHIEISRETAAWAWAFPDVSVKPLGFLQPVVHAAGDLIVAGDLRRLKRCSDPSCGWLFYDTSKNNSRRWCSMKGCGNRAKVSKFYRLHKTEME